ncbi:MAG: nicotinamide-nucleotide amidohydrolase family protein [Planctomycetaceae bacterium]|nr:nicotinamide-nucleotide amidohydrolase family protein [Planctomycetaceae bacterium]
MEDRLLSNARRLADVLQQADLRIVFAESCTAGLVAATMARVPGISSHLCGSAVVYRNETKTAWLHVSADDLANESIGPVSEEVAFAMATGVLKMTPEADIAASITGHLGPDAPADLDGLIVVSIAHRNAHTPEIHVHHTFRHQLTALEADVVVGQSLRDLRQHEATQFVLQAVTDSINETDSPG